MNLISSLLFIGAGLASTLSALWMSERHPDLSILLLEESDKAPLLTWSFHEGDLTPDQFQWIKPLISQSWSAYEVRFPSYRRVIEQPYHSIRSLDFYSRADSRLGTRLKRGASVQRIGLNECTLATGETYSADVILDGRGWQAPSGRAVAYQKFVGLDVQLKAPHGRAFPLLMDATVAQKDGYRFVYLLPWTENKILIEDTRYSDAPDIDPAEFEQDIRAYAEHQGWSVDRVVRREQGVLPIPLRGEPFVPRHAEDGVAQWGTRAGLFHATTSYSLPWAVRSAFALSEMAMVSNAVSLRVNCQRYARTHWKNQRMFRYLNRVLFEAVKPDQRYRVMEDFYRKSDRLIAAFYAGRMTPWKWATFFMSRPPVPLAAAWRCRQ